MVAVGYSLDEIRQALGLVSIPAARDRVRALRSLLEEREMLRRGQNNEILVTPEGLELLRRLEEIHQGGVPLKQAANKILDELGVHQDELAKLKAKLEELRRRVNDLNSQVGELKEACDRLRRSWVMKLLGVRLPRLPAKTPSDKPPQDKRN